MSDANPSAAGTPRTACPILETPRLRLRGHSQTDFDASFALWSDPAVTRFIGGRPQTGEEVWARLLRYAGHWSWLGYGFWAIEDRATGAMIGEAGFLSARRALTPPMDGVPEIGWALAPGWHGRGLAQEAVAAALKWGDGHFGGGQVFCIIHPDNAPSLGVAAKTGFSEHARTTYHGEPTIVLSR